MNQGSEGSQESNMNHDSDTIVVVDTQDSEQASTFNDEQALTLNHNSMAHFKIIDILGKGGMGAVYKAKDLALERFVAIKMLRISNTEQPLMLAEAKTISKLNHPNIVTIYDIARDDDANFIVMEWVNGKPLSSVILAEGLSLKIVIAYAKQMVSAIACAHQQGIIHRDIKPQNIMVDISGRIKILDFGIAALVAPENFSEQPTAKSIVNESDQSVINNSKSQPILSETMGTPQYMAPEQILGQASDARSDLFSLGIVLYEMLTGVKPFLGLNIKQITQAITNGKYTPIAEHLSEHKSAENKAKTLPAELIAIVDMLLQVDPSERYQTAQDLAHDIKVLDNKINSKRTWWQQQHWLTQVILATTIIAMLGWGLRGVFFPPSTQDLIARQLVESKKIAFLPFDNISGDPVLQIFSDGIATMLSSDLAEVGYQQGDGTTWVLPASEIRQLEDPSVTGVYNKYGVDVIVTGSIQHMGSTRSIHLSLVNAADGRQLKSAQLTIDAKNLFAAQTNIRQQVMTLLGWKIPPELSQQFAAKKPSFDGAYKYYLQGQGYLYRFDYENNIEKALASFQSAISLDANYADAYVGLAQAQLRSFLEYQNSNLLIAMKKTIEQLVQIDSNHQLLSYLQGELALNQGDYNKAAELFNKNITEKPNFIKAYTSLSYAYQQLKKLDQAEQILLIAYQLMPSNNTVLVELGIFHYSNGSYDKAIEYFTLLTQQAPNNYIAYLNISACYYLKGDFQQAIAAVQKSLAIKPNADGYANLGTYNFMLREYDEAVAAYEKMIDLNDTDYLNWGNLADAYRFANNVKYEEAFKKAIALGERALQLNPNNKQAISSLAYYYANIENVNKTHFYTKSIDENDEGVDHFFIAAAYARLNIKVTAIKHLTLSINHNYSIAEIRTSPLFDSLKNDLEFQQLMNSGTD